MTLPLSTRADQLALIEQMPAGIALFDLQMCYQAVSKRFLSDLARVSGTRALAPFEVIGRAHCEIFPNLPGQWHAIDARVLRGEEVTQDEDPVVCEGGRTEWLRWSMKPWLTADGALRGALLSCEVISDLVRTRRALAESEDFLRGTFHNPAVGIMHVTPQGRLLRANDALPRILGYSGDEFVSLPLQAITHPGDRERSREPFQALIEGRATSYQLEKRYLRKDGSVLHGKLTASCVRKCDGSVDYIVGVIQDDTERRRAEAQLRENEERFRTAVLDSPLPVVLFDDRERIHAISQGWVDKTLYSREELCQDGDAGSPGEGPRHLRQIISTAPQVGPSEWRITTKDGRERDWSVHNSALGTLSDGRRLFVCRANDVTERTARERALAKSEARFRATFENAAVGIVHVAPRLAWLRVNEAFCRILAFEPDELIAKPMRDVVHPDDYAAGIVNAALMRTGRINSAEMDGRFVRKDGSIVICRLTVSCVRKTDGSVDYFVGIVQDITAQRQAEWELRKSEERFKASVLHSPMPMMLFDDQEDILAVSQSWLDECGYSGAELRRLEDWTDRAYGCGSAAILQRLRAVIATEPPAEPSEIVIRTKDGRERLWSFVKAPLGAQSDGRRLFVTIAQDLTERRAREVQVRLLLSEVNHRAKNLLSVVQAIVRHTVACSRDDFIERLTTRIQALAANHDLLVRNEWRGVEVDDLVHIQLAPFADLLGSRIVVYGPKLRLGTTAAQSIGLVLHELATNAGKYGALATQAGLVDIRWDVAKDDTFTMSWIESGGPPVAVPAHRGFGTEVVESIARYNLKGKADLAFAASGVTWHLACPTTQALEATMKARTRAATLRR